MLHYLNTHEPESMKTVLRRRLASVTIVLTTNCAYNCPGKTKGGMAGSRVQPEGDGVYFVFNVILRTIPKKGLSNSHKTIR